MPRWDTVPWAPAADRTRQKEASPGLADREGEPGKFPQVAGSRYVRPGRTAFVARGLEQITRSRGAGTRARRGETQHQGVLTEVVLAPTPGQLDGGSSRQQGGEVGGEGHPRTQRSEVANESRALQPPHTK